MGKKYYYLGTHDPYFNESYDTLKDAEDSADSYCVTHEVNSCLIGEDDYCWPKIDVDAVLDSHAEDMHEGFLGIFDCLNQIKKQELESELAATFRQYIKDNDLCDYFKYVKVIKRYERK